MQGEQASSNRLLGASAPRLRQRHDRENAEAEKAGESRCVRTNWNKTFCERSTMLTNIVPVIVLLLATWAMPGIAVAQKAAVPKQQDKLALGENQVKQLLLLIDTDENGKISKQE